MFIQRETWSVELNETQSIQGVLASSPQSTKREWRRKIAQLPSSVGLGKARMNSLQCTALCLQEDSDCAGTQPRPPPQGLLDVCPAVEEVIALAAFPENHGIYQMLPHKTRRMRE